jgi:hypothetical protein
MYTDGMIRAVCIGIAAGFIAWCVWTMFPDSEMSWQANCQNHGGHVVSDGRQRLYCVQHGELVDVYEFER